jgi:hypothetical protein
MLNPISYRVCLYLFYPGRGYPVVSVGHLGIAVGVALMAFLNLEHPNCFASPNVCLAPSLASFSELVGGALCGGPISDLSSGLACNHSSSLKAHVHKKMDFLDNGPSLYRNAVSGTSVLPTDATISRRRKKHHR